MAMASETGVESSTCSIDTSRSRLKSSMRGSSKWRDRDDKSSRQRTSCWHDFHSTLSICRIINLTRTMWIRRRCTILATFQCPWRLLGRWKRQNHFECSQIEYLMNLKDDSNESKNWNKINFTNSIAKLRKHFAISRLHWLWMCSVKRNGKNSHIKIFSREKQFDYFVRRENSEYRS